jgi:chromosome segregation ATPase
VGLFIRLSGLVALFGAAALGPAQDRPPSAPSEAAQLAEKTAGEWSALASSLEQRVARLLPCDPRVRSDIEEAARASDARFAALTSYWQEIAKRSNEQAEAARTLIAGNDPRIADWKADRTDSEQEQTRLAAQVADLRESVGQQSALATAVRVLNGISQSAAAATKQAATREEAAAKLDANLHELTTATEARQAAIENELKALATENSRWSAYYGARVTRAQMECSLTSPAADPARTPAKKGR